LALGKETEILMRMGCKCLVPPILAVEAEEAEEEAPLAVLVVLEWLSSDMQIRFLLQQQQRALLP
jgi:hypothetical protein